MPSLKLHYFPPCTISKVQKNSRTFFVRHIDHSLVQEGEGSHVGRLPVVTMAWAWVRKHRRTLLLAAGVAGAGACTFYYNSRRAKMKVIKEEEDSQSARLRKEAEERAAVQLQSHFQSIQRISDTTTLASVLPHLKARLFELVNLSGLTEKLVAGKEDPQALGPREKFQLWQELKVLSFTRTISAIWAVGLLDLFIRTQLNVLGRHLYIDTARDMSTSKLSGQHRPLSMSCQYKFIAFADYLPYKGLEGLVRDVHTVVERVMKSKSLKEPCKMSDLGELLVNIRQGYSALEVDWVQYVLPEQNELPDDLAAALSAADEARISITELSALEDTEKLNQLMLETRSVLSSEEFRDVLGVSLDAIFNAILEDLSATYQGSVDFGVPLAKLLPPVASRGNAVLEHPEENRFIQIIGQLPQVQAFCALVYSSTDEVS